MRVFKPVFAGLLPLFLAGGPSLALAQQSAPVTEAKKPTAEEKKKLRETALQLLDDTVAETQTLRIPENRIVLLSAALPMLAKQDPAKARAVAESVILSLTQIFLPPNEEDDPEGVEGQARKRGRDRIFAHYVTTLSQFSEVDGEGALELFQSSQGQISPQLADWQRSSLETLGKQLELAAARTNPAKLAAIIHKLLEKKDFTNAIQTLGILVQKDPERGERSFSDVLTDLVRSEVPARDRVSHFLALANLIAIGDERTEGKPSKKTSSDTRTAGKTPFKVSEDVRRKLFTAFARMAVESLPTGALPPRGNSEKPLPRIAVPEAAATAMLYLDDIERYAPELADQMKQRVGNIEPPVRVDPFERLTADIESGRLSVEFLESAITIIPSSPGKAETIDRLRKAIEKIGDIKVRDRLLRQLDDARTVGDVAGGKVTMDEFTRLVERTRSATTRHKLLVSFAGKLIEQKEYGRATELLDQAAGIAAGTENPRQRLLRTLAVAELFLRYDPARAFDLYEPQFDRHNEVLTAMATFGGYLDLNGDLPLKGDEFNLAMLQAVSEVLPATLIPLKKLARTDFDRTRALVDRVRFPEIRAKLRLEILSAVLQDNGSTETPAAGPGTSDPEQENPQQ